MNSSPIPQPPGLGDYVFEAKGWGSPSRLVSGLVEGSLRSKLGTVLFVREESGELVACTSERVAVHFPKTFFKDVVFK